jgi:hypothetical protein
MSILAEYCPELCLREFNSPNKDPEECLPENLIAGNTYNFLKLGQRHYWLLGEIALRKTIGDEKLSRPIASIIILNSTHFVKDNKVWTKGSFKVIEIFDPNDPKVHFETTDKIKNETPRPKGRGIN